MDSSLRLTACLTFPATIGLILFRQEIVRLLYERGSFLPSDTLKTSQVVFFYALGLFSYSAVKILVPTFYALNDTRTPVRTSMLTVGAKIALNLVFVFPLGFLGLALATTLASWLNLGLLLKRFRRQVELGRRKWQIGSYFKILLASLIMGFLALLSFRASEPILSGSGSFILALRLGFAIFVGAASYIALLRMLNVEEGREIVHIIRLKK